MKRLRNIRAVTFDVGGTLIDPWPSVGHVYAEVAARHGLKNLSAGMLNQRFRAAFRARMQRVQTEAAWAELVDEVFAGLTAPPPSQTFFPELYRQFSEPGAWRIYDDALPALQALAARGVRLGVISNWDDRLRRLLERLRLTDHFEIIIISSEVGCAKPGPAIFEIALRKLKLAAETVVHVGDDLNSDIRGAQSAGLHALQIRRRARRVRAGQIRSLRELPARLPD